MNSFIVARSFISLAAPLFISFVTATLKEKLGAIDDVKAGKPIDDVAKKFGISKSQVYKLYKTKDTLLNTVANGACMCL